MTTGLELISKSYDDAEAAFLAQVSDGRFRVRTGQPGQGRCGGRRAVLERADRGMSVRSWICPAKVDDACLLRQPENVDRFQRSAWTPARVVDGATGRRFRLGLFHVEVKRSNAK